MEAFVKAHQTVIIVILLLLLVCVLTWLSVEVTMIYDAVGPILNSGLGRIIAST